jgi:hypothetical protein
MSMAASAVVRKRIVDEHLPLRGSSWPARVTEMTAPSVPLQVMLISADPAPAGTTKVFSDDPTAENVKGADDTGFADVDVDADAPCWLCCAEQPASMASSASGARTKTSFIPRRYLRQSARSRVTTEDSPEETTARVPVP